MHPMVEGVRLVVRTRKAEEGIQHDAYRALAGGGVLLGRG